MGTFTKSFGAAGGYIAGSKPLIQWLRRKSQSFIYPSSMSAPVALQIIKSMEMIMYSPEGLKRVQTLAMNSRYIFFDKIHILKALFFFDKIHLSKYHFLTKFTFSKSHFSQN